MFRPTPQIFLIVFVLLTGIAVGQPAASAVDKFRSGIEFLKAHNYESALEEFRASARLDPKSAPTHGNIGFSLLALKRPEEAATAFREASKLAPKDGSFQTALCRALVATEKYDEAIKSCQEGVRLIPDSAAAHAALIDALEISDRVDPELAQFINEALIRFRDNEEVLLSAAEYYSSNQNRRLAVELWEQLTKIRPNFAYYLGRFAHACMEVERESEAILAARRTLEIEPDNAFAHYAMGKLFLELGQHGDASRAFDIARSRLDRLPSAQYYFGVSESRAGRTQSAIEAFRVSVKRNPTGFNSLFALGQALNDDAQYEAAVEPLRQAVALQPKDLEAKAGLGLALFESAQFPEAIKVLEDADRIWPANEVITMFLRVARSRQEHIPQIAEMKERAKENPRDLGVRVSLIELLAFARRIGEIEPYVQEILAHRPKGVSVYQRIAVAYSTAGKHDKAFEMYRIASQLGEDPGTYMGLASAYGRRGQWDEAFAAYAKVITLKPDAGHIMKIYADELRDNGRRREALEMYKRSLAIFPTFGPTLSSAAILSAKLDEMDAARTYLATLKTVDPETASRVEQCLMLLKYIR